MKKWKPELNRTDSNRKRRWIECTEKETIGNRSSLIKYFGLKKNNNNMCIHIPDAVEAYHFVCIFTVCPQAFNKISMNERINLKLNDILQSDLNRISKRQNVYWNKKYPYRPCSSYFLSFYFLLCSKPHIYIYVYCL